MEILNNFEKDNNTVLITLQGKYCNFATNTREEVFVMEIFQK